MLISEQADTEPALSQVHVHMHIPLTWLMCYIDLRTQMCTSLALRSISRPAAHSPIRTPRQPRTLGRIQSHPAGTVRKKRATSRRCGHNFRPDLNQSSRVNHPAQTNANPTRRADENKHLSTVTEVLWTESVHHMASSSASSPNVACGQRLDCLHFCVMRSVFQHPHGTSML